MIVNLISIFDPEWVGIADCIDDGMLRSLRRLGVGVNIAGRCDSKDFSQKAGGLTIAMAPEWYEMNPEDNDGEWLKSSPAPTVGWLIEKIPEEGETGEKDQIARKGRASFYSKVAPLFDVLITSIPGDVEKLKRFGAKNVFYMPFGVDETVFKSLGGVRDIELGFVGWKVHAPRRKFFHRLTRDYGLQRIVAQSDGLSRKEATNNYVKALNRISVCVNIPNTFGGLSTRVFETLACETFLLQPRPPEDYQADLKQFEEGKEIIYYEPDGSDIGDLISFYKLNTAKAEEIISNGRNAILQRHTISHRIQKIFDICYKLKLL